MARSVLIVLGCVTKIVSVNSMMARSTSTSCEHVEPEHVEEAFKSFIEQHGRGYKSTTSEYSMRLGLFQRTHAKVTQHNCKRGASWTAGLTSFADRSDVELASYHGFSRQKSRPRATTVESLTEFSAEANQVSLPTEVSWKHLQAMHIVHDQGSCGSCWAVASATVLSAHAELWSAPRNVSVQQLLSCTPNERNCGGSGGCDGATGELAMAYALQVGVTTDEEFPYQAVDVPCPAKMAAGADRGNFALSRIGMTSYLQLESNMARPLMTKLVELGPIATSVAADDAWFWYFGGIMDSCDTKKPIVNHLVVLVGYGSEEKTKTKFYELQNSWGSSWGDNGFIKLKRTDEDDELCGMDDKPQEGLACEGENEPVKVCGMCGVLFDAVVPIFSGSARSFLRS
eukprot:TRINITY_DN912_c0_g1_i2.p1 TRINITY_DN912_c0_g1~~TRINITY_DN912_c0_g1_i2.p1  ORF type:complete len:399 (+),score=47.95 TRINITY_DN912_c0_g1_i2:51-1247(+)